MGIVNFISLIFLACWISSCCNVTSNKKVGKLKVKYEYETMLMNTSKKKWQVFFIVDSSSTIVYKGRAFYKFIFSSDSLEPTGYIHFDRKSQAVNFISEEYSLNASDIESNKVESLFFHKPGSSSLIRSFGELGSHVILISKKDRVGDSRIMTTVKRIRPLASENRYIVKLIFGSNLYPDQINVSDPVLMEEVKLKGVRFWN